MKIEQALPSADAKVIRRYDAGYILVNDDEFRTSLILTPTELDADWPPQSFADLTAEHWDALLARKPDLVLIGTGKAQRFPAPEIMAPLYRAGVGVEVMKTAAACRTFNILTNEGRNVVAGLLMIEE